MSVTIYHNPSCGTSRNTLAMIRQSGDEPEVIEYLKNPPSRARLIALIKELGISVRALLREKGTPYAELGLADPKWSDDQLIDFMLEHPILINRPIVVTPKGVRLCRPSELVLDLLDRPADNFVKEDGEVVARSSLSAAAHLPSVTIARHNIGMELTPRLRLMNWLVSQGLTGLPENDLLRGFCQRCCAAGLPLSRGLVFIDTLHPIFEGRGFRWNDGETNESDAFEYGSTSQGDANRNWRRTTFFHMLEHGHDEMVIDLADCDTLDFSMINDLAEKGHKHFAAFVHRFGEAGTIGEMDCFYSYWTTRRAEGFGEHDMSALRDLVPVLGLAVKSAAQAEIVRTLGRVYLGRDAAEQVLRGKILRGVTERIKAVLWFSDVRGSTAISERIEPDEIIPFLNDYAQASIDAIHDAGGEVLKLIGDGVLAIFTDESMAVAKRVALRAEHRFRHNIKALNVRRAAEGRPVTTAYVGLHVGEVFYGNIGSEDRLDFTVVGPAVNEVSRIASMCSSVDRELLTSSDFRSGLDAVGRNHLVSTGRFVLRGISRAQDLYTLDPDIAADEVVAGKYERYLSG